MNMTKRSALLFLSGLTVFSQANAYDGQITFEGSVQDVTCDVTGGVDGGTESTSGSFTIDLPVVYTTDLVKSGDRSGDTKFYLKLSGAQCVDGKTANVVFEKADSDIDSASGNLNNTITKAAGGAGNVQVILLNKDKTDINLNTVSATHQPAIIASNSARFDYWAQYYATGQSTAGTVRALVAYSISYN